MYNYKVTVNRIIDGDTAVVSIDLGFGIWLREQHIRLYGFDAPELHSKKEAERTHAQKAFETFQAFAMVDRPVTIRTYKDAKEKYGRWLADIDVAGQDAATYLRSMDCAKRAAY